MIDTGKAYNAANQLFVGGVNELLMHCGRDNTIMVGLNQFTEGLQEIIQYHSMLFDQIQRSIKTQLQNFIAQEIHKLHEMRKQFCRISEDVETAAVRNAAASRHKPQEAEAASHILLATRKCFRHLALDYILQINTLQTQQKFKLLNTIMSYFHSQFTFFHQGYDLSKDLEPLMKSVSSQLDRLSVDSAAQRRELEYRHSVVQQRDVASDTRMEFLSAPSRGVAIEGYLFKRSNRKVKTWNRRWFTVKDNRLSYQKSLKEPLVVVVEDLRLCTVKPCDSIERRFCFDLVSIHKSCMLQADSESLRHAWVQAVQSSIDTAYRERSDLEPPEMKRSSSAASLKSGSPTPARESSPKVSGVLQTARRVPGNSWCCDCGREDPRWASINLGVVLCIECSGIHRSLGVHVSKVRSLTLDSWEPELLKVICGLGNDVINSIYESRWEETGDVKAAADSPRLVKESWIKSKYVEKKFVKRRTTAASEGHTHGDSAADTLDPSELHPGMRLYRAALEGDLPSMAEALAHGADVNWVNKEEDGKTPLIISTCGGSLVSSEFLLQNGANVNYRDKKGRGAIHAATYQGHTGQVCLFLKRGANQYAADEKGQDPLSIAMETANADIVTLLRMARMNEEMRDSEGVFGGMGDDETFQDIFRDFSHMASHDPEKLARRKPGLASSADESRK
ncbi:arf-GAP with coiled-coil, ANK repeat and PH domain-containing protein 2 isoform X2 [Latimeria chalumnae]